LVLKRCTIPEGPEVRRYALDLSKRLSGRSLASVSIKSGRYLKKPPSGFEEFSLLLPLSILGVGVHGKFMYILLEGQQSIWSTLGMSGQWSNKKSQHTRIELVLNDGSVFYNDIRNFGTLKFVKGKESLIEKLSSLGPDLLSEKCSDKTFIERIRTKNKKTIVQVLMDQSVVSGVGNYIKADSLWLSRISPHRKVSEITDEELSFLNKNIRDVMIKSFESGGATIRSYKNFDGENGEYGSKFIVYNKKVDLDGNEVVNEQTKDGRTTWWSPERQK